MCWLQQCSPQGVPGYSHGAAVGLGVGVGTGGSVGGGIGVAGVGAGLGGLGVPQVPSPVQFPGAQHDLRCPSSDTQHSRDAGHTKSLVAAPQHWLSRGL